MRKILAFVCFLSVLVSVFAGTVIVNAEEVPKMEFDPAVPVPGEKLTAVYTQSETPAFFGWYLFEESDVTVVDGVATVNSDADYTAAGIPQYGATIDLPETAAGKYIYALAGRGADQNYSTIQSSQVVKIPGEAVVLQAPPAPAYPTKKITVFGFEHIDEGAKLGVQGSDLGPAQLRRANGELWNPGAANWASTQYGTFTDLYELVSVKEASAPEGSKAGKWINKMGETVPEGKGEWTGSLLSIFLDEPRSTYAVGATEFMFWMDTTHYYVPDAVTFLPRISIQQYDDQGQPTAKYATYVPSATNACYYQAASGEWVGTVIGQSGFFTVPAGYKGYVRIPIAAYEPASWNADANPVMQLNNITQIAFYFFTYAGADAKDTYALIDDLSFAGNDLKAMPAKYYEKAIDPAESLLEEAGIVSEGAYADKTGGTRASVKWDPIEGYSQSYSVNVYKLEKEDDDIGTYVKSVENIKDTGIEVTGLDKNTLYAFQVFAYNAAGERIAIYDAVTLTTTGADDAAPAAPAASGNEVTAAQNPATGDQNLTLLLVMLAVSLAGILLGSRRILSHRRPE